jgi:murein tripeptide amidase MpaA
VRLLLEQAFEEEISAFYEQNLASFTVKPFQEFGLRLTQYMREHAHKKAIVLTSRVHPGEPQASHMIDGSLKFLVSDHLVAKELRKHFVFKVVPMLNPDGVIHGNYRCSLIGCDLNRKWL